jgi:hypothetical protein
MMVYQSAFGFTLHTDSQACPSITILALSSFGGTSLRAGKPQIVAFQMEVTC